MNYLNSKIYVFTAIFNNKFFDFLFYNFLLCKFFVIQSIILLQMNLRDQFSTDKYVAHKFLQLPPFNNVQAEYVWIDGSGEHVRSKTRTLNFVPKSVDGKRLIHLIFLIHINFLLL